MARKNLDLIGIMLIVIINLGWTLIPSPPIVVGLILALPLVFVLPGYTLTEALFKRSSDVAEPRIHRPRLRIGQPFNVSDRLISSLGLSLAIDIFTGFILNLLPIGLQILSWAVSLSILTTAFSFIAVYRRRGATTNSSEKKGAPSQFRVAIYEFILIGLAVILITLSIGFSALSAQQQSYPDFTQFWLVPSNQVNNTCAVLIGIRSSESTTVTYSVKLMINGVQVIAWPSVNLQPQGEWDQFVSVGSEDSDNMYIEARLYRLDKPGAVYRNVHLTLNRLKGEANGPAQQCSV